MVEARGSHRDLFSYSILLDQKHIKSATDTDMGTHRSQLELGHSTRLRKHSQTNLL